MQSESEVMQHYKTTRNERVSAMAIPLGTQARLFDLSHLYETFHRESETPRGLQKSDSQ